MPSRTPKTGTRRYWTSDEKDALIAAMRVALPSIRDATERVNELRSDPSMFRSEAAVRGEWARIQKKEAEGIATVERMIEEYKENIKREEREKKEKGV